MTTQYQGNYSYTLSNNLDANTQKRYIMAVQRGKPILDAELSEIAFTAFTGLRNYIRANFDVVSSADAENPGRLGSIERAIAIDNSFKIVANAIPGNDFTITGGNGTFEQPAMLFVKGIPAIITGDFKYSEQSSAPALNDDRRTNSTIPALTTPVANRVDTVYIDLYFAEVSSEAGSEYQDTAIKDIAIGQQTSNRFRIVQDILVAEGVSMPTDGPDIFGIYHRYLKLATVNRLAADATITNAMIEDERFVTVSLKNLTNGQGNIWVASLASGSMSISGNLNLDGDLIPNVLGTSNLGDPTHRFANLYMASNIDSAGGLTMRHSGATGEALKITRSGASVDNLLNVENFFTIDYQGKAVFMNDVEIHGTMTSIQATNLEITDKNVIVNKGDTITNGDGSGLTVERNGTFGSLVYRSTAQGKFAIGDIGSEVDIVTSTRSIGVSGNGLSGGGDFSADRTITSNATAANTASTIVFRDVSGNFNANTITLLGLSASQAVFTDASKNLVSNTITGSGSVAMSNTPTFTGTVTVDGFTITDANYLYAASINKTQVLLNSGGTDFGTVQNDANDTWSLGHKSGNNSALGTSVLKWTKLGAVTITGSLTVTAAVSLQADVTFTTPSKILDPTRVMTASAETGSITDPVVGRNDGSGTGIYYSGLNAWDLTVGGVRRFGIDALGNADFVGTVTAPAGFVGNLSGTASNLNRSIFVSGNGLSGGGLLNADRTITSNAVSTNTPSTIVFRDSSGDFAANAITANSISTTGFSIGAPAYTGALRVQGGATWTQDYGFGNLTLNETVRLEGTGSFGSFSAIAFGDGSGTPFVFISEYVDDGLMLHADHDIVYSSGGGAYNHKFYNSTTLSLSVGIGASSVTGTLSVTSDITSSTGNITSSAGNVIANKYLLSQVQSAPNVFLSTAGSGWGVIQNNNVTTWSLGWHDGANKALLGSVSALSWTSSGDVTANFALTTTGILTASSQIFARSTNAITGVNFDRGGLIVGAASNDQIQIDSTRIQRITNVGISGTLSLNPIGGAVNIASSFATTTAQGPLATLDKMTAATGYYEHGRTTALGEWQSFIPGLSPYAGTVGSITVTYAQYSIIGKTLLIKLAFSWTAADSSVIGFNFNLPVTVLRSNNEAQAAFIQVFGPPVDNTGFVSLSSTTTAQILTNSSTRVVVSSDASITASFMLP